MQRGEMGRNKSSERRSTDHKINHFLNDRSIMEDIELLMLNGLYLTFNTIHILLLHLLAVTYSLLSVPDITGKTTLQTLPLSLPPSVRDKYRKRGDGRADSQCHSTLGPAWQLEH